MNYSQIVSALNNLSAAELSALNVEVIDLIKLRRKQVARSVKSTLEVGMSVKVNHPKAYGKIYKIAAIKQTKAHLSEEGRFGLTVVPMSLIESI